MIELCGNTQGVDEVACKINGQVLLRQIQRNIDDLKKERCESVEIASKDIDYRKRIFEILKSLDDKILFLEDLIK